MGSTSIIFGYYFLGPVCELVKFKTGLQTQRQSESAFSDFLVDVCTTLFRRITQWRQNRAIFMFYWTRRAKIFLRAVSVQKLDVFWTVLKSPYPMLWVNISGGDWWCPVGGFASLFWLQTGPRLFSFYFLDVFLF